MSRDDDIEAVLNALRANPSTTADGLYIIVMLSLIAKAVRDLAK